MVGNGLFALGRELSVLLLAIAAALQPALERVGRDACSLRMGDWRAAAWELERRFPKLYGRRARAEIVVAVDERPHARVEFYKPCS